MSADERQPLPVNQADIDLIKRTFDEGLLRSMRNLFLGLEVSDSEKELIKTTFKSAELRALMRKRFVPRISPETPLGHELDVWDGVEKMVFGYSESTAYQALHYKQLAIDMAETCLNLLEDPNGPRPKLDYSPVMYPNDNLGVQLCARNIFISMVKTQLLTFYLTTLQKDEPEQVKKGKREKDSAK